MSQPDERTHRLENSVRRKRVLVCLGSGGVGKTTTSAVVGLHAAILGRKAIVCTVDPAKRLANSLGVSELDDTGTRISPDAFESIGVQPKGTLYAMMLDMKHAFDRVVEDHSDPETRDRIFENRFYRYFSTSLAGTQEYSAMQRLYELYEEGDYDLIVLDTAPTAYALDFLDAPKRLFAALDSAAFEWLAHRGKTGFRLGFGLVKLGAGSVIRVLSRFIGTAFIEEFGHFVGSVGSLWDVFKQRTARTMEILAGEDVEFLVVTSPDHVSLEEALYIYEELTNEGMTVGGFIVNRVHQPFVPQPVLEATTEELARRLEDTLDEENALEDVSSLSRRLQQNAREFHVLANRDIAQLEWLRRRVPDEVPIHTVPFFSTDIYSFSGLNRIREELFRLRKRLTPADRTLGRL